MQAELGRKDSYRGGILRRGARWMIAGAVLAAAYGLFTKFEWRAPRAALREPLSFVGERARIQLDVVDRGSGLAALEVMLEAAGTVYQIHSERWPRSGWRGSGVHEKSLDLEIQPRIARVPEGSAALVVRALDHSWLNLFVTRPPTLSQPVEVDYSPPRVEVLTLQHYMRLGGSDLVVYRTSADSVRSGVQVEGYFFPAVGGLFPDPAIRAALFAVPQDLTAKAAPRVIAEDRAGNRRELRFWVAVKPQAFREKTLDIDDEFLQAKVPDLLRTNGLQPHQDDLVEGYLEINRDLRKASEARIREICSRFEPRPLWSQVFLRQPNSAPLSSFADRRTYTYKGQVIDSQVHLGFDLASLRQSPVAAANDGTVTFAGNLGIYGETVVLDHGLGLFTLYGHLSSIRLEPGAAVKRGDVLGLTGETGLAGGDHLHFSTVVHGVHVDPLEWWDPKWVRDHVLAKIEEFGKGASAAEAAGRAGGASASS